MPIAATTPPSAATTASMAAGLTGAMVATPQPSATNERVSMTNIPTSRDWPDSLDEGSEGWTPLTCKKCQQLFHGWKLKTICFVCAVPVFPTMRHISAVAVRFQGRIYGLPAPNRHHHILRLIRAEHGKTRPNVQGFLDNRGKFLSRKDAMRVARKANQVYDPTRDRSPLLYSEDLW